jgi:hypothetical protein
MIAYRFIKNLLILTLFLIRVRDGLLHSLLPLQLAAVLSGKNSVANRLAG